MLVCALWNCNIWVFPVNRVLWVWVYTIHSCWVFRCRSSQSFSSGSHIQRWNNLSNSLAFTPIQQSSCFPFIYLKGKTIIFFVWVLQLLLTIYMLFGKKIFFLESWWSKWSERQCVYGLSLDQSRWNVRVVRQRWSCSFHLCHIEFFHTWISPS